MHTLKILFARSIQQKYSNGTIYFQCRFIMLKEIKILKNLSCPLLIKFFNALFFEIIIVKFVGVTIMAVIGRNTEQEATDQINLSPMKRVNRISFFSFLSGLSNSSLFLHRHAWSHSVVARSLYYEQTEHMQTAAKKHHFRPKDVAL